MSNSDFTNSKYPHPDGLSTDELREILRLDLDVQDEEADPEYQDYIFRVMEVLELREPASAHMVEDAWQQFIKENPSVFPNPSIAEQNYTDTISTQKKKNHTRRFSFSRILIASAMTILLFASVTASAFNLNVFEIIGQWTQDLFHLGVSSEERAKQGLSKNNFQLTKDIQSELVLSGISESVFPKWLPEGLELAQTQKSILPDRILFFILMSSKDGTNISITVTKYASLPENLLTEYEKAHTNVVKYQKEGIDHYIMSNYDKVSISWLFQDIEVSITGDFTMKQAKKIINSIYEEN